MYVGIGRDDSIIAFEKPIKWNLINPSSTGFGTSFDFSYALSRKATLMISLVYPINLLDLYTLFRLVASINLYKINIKSE